MMVDNKIIQIDSKNGNSKNCINHIIIINVIFFTY